MDSGQGVWNLWWARESLLRGWNPLVTNYVYYPQQINLLYQTLSLPNALLALPALLALGPVAAFNAVALLSFALGGYRRTGWPAASPAFRPCWRAGWCSRSQPTTCSCCWWARWR